MSNIPKVPKLPKTKSVSSQDHTYPEHEALLNKTWTNLDKVLEHTFGISDEKLKSLQDEAVQSYIEDYEKRLRELNAELSSANPAQKKLITETINKIKDYILNFKPPTFDNNQSAVEVTNRIFQKELLNEKDVSVGYIDIYVDMKLIKALTLMGNLLPFYMASIGDESDNEDAYINKLCDISFKAPVWSVNKSNHNLYVDVRTSVPTLAQLTRELLVIKDYMDGPNLAVVFDKIENPLIAEVLKGHKITCINLSDFD